MPLLPPLAGISPPADTAHIRPTHGARRETIILLGIVFTLAVSFGVGFLLQEDSSGGAKGDFYNFHWKAIERFTQMPWRQAVTDYPSATNPLAYMIASLTALNADAYRAMTSVLAFLIFLIMSSAFYLRLASSRMNWAWCVFAGSGLLISPTFRSAAFWGNTDVLPFLFCALTAILLSKFPDPPPDRSLASNIGMTVAVALTAVCAFYTRQFYAFVVVMAAWTLLTRARVSPVIVVFIFGVAMIPELLLIDIWKGINPPTFHKQASPSLGNVLLIGANVGFFSIPLIVGSIRTSLGDVVPAWWGRRATVAAVIGLLIFLVALRGVEWPTLGGGIIVKAGQMMGRLGNPFFLSMSYLGLLAAVLFSLRSLTNVLLTAAFLAPFLAAYPIYQRYFEPSLIVALLLFADLQTSRALFTKRVLISNCVFSLLLLGVSAGHYYLTGQQPSQIGLTRQSDEEVLQSAHLETAFQMAPARLRSAPFENRRLRQ